jgi:AcrR family transcriptional regulator
MTDEDALLEKFPRRTQRRQQTRARILKSALKLFRKVGYGAATMNAIADAADVHVTTLFTHFKNKRDLAVSLNDSSVALLEQMVADSRGKVPFFEFFQSLVLGTARRIEHASDPTLSLWHEMRRDPELTFAWVQYEQSQVVLLADYVAQDYGLDPASDYRPALVASLMVSSSWISHRRWTESVGGLDLETETLAAVKTATEMARAVLPRL